LKTREAQGKLIMIKH